MHMEKRSLSRAAIALVVTGLACTANAQELPERVGITVGTLGKRCRRERAHLCQVTLQSLADRFALAAQDIELAPLASLLQPEVEFLPAGELRHRHGVVAQA